MSVNLEKWVGPLQYLPTGMVMVVEIQLKMQMMTMIPLLIQVIIVLKETLGGRHLQLQIMIQMAVEILPKTQMMTMMAF